MPLLTGVQWNNLRWIANYRVSGYFQSVVPHVYSVLLRVILFELIPESKVDSEGLGIVAILPVARLMYAMIP